MQAIQDYTKLLSVRLIDPRSRKQTERIRDAVLRERRENKDTLRYCDFLTLRANALVN